MASQVNTRFVLIAGIITVCVVGGVGFIGYRMMNVGGEQNIARGDDFLKAGDLKKAINEYGRAVNKDRGNADWIRTWLAAIEKFTPATRQQYEDMYRGEYTGALRALCEADRTGIEPFRRLLDERYSTIVPYPSLPGWEALARDYDDLAKTFQGDQKSKDILGRFHGLARAGMLTSNPDLEQRLVDEGMKDLRAALAADPADTDSLLALVTMSRSMADREAKAGRDAASVKLRADAHDLLANFLKANPDSARVRFILLTDEMAESVTSKRVTGTYADVFKANKDRIEELVASIKRQPPEKTDAIVALTISPWVSVITPDGQKVVDDLLSHVQKGHADDPIFLLGRARVQMQMRDFPGAEQLAKATAALPDKPVSLPGLMLYNYRAQAIRLQADIVFVQWEEEVQSKENKNTAKADALVQKIRDLRTELAARMGETAPEILSIDGRLDLISGDIQGARVRISNYNDITKRSDPAMLAIEANLLKRLGQLGAARSVYEHILQIDDKNVRVLQELATIEADLKDYAAAAEHLTLASRLVPSDESLKQMAQNAVMLASQDFTKDPVLGCLSDAIKLATGLTGDQPAAIVKLRKCLVEHPGDIRLSLQLAQLLAATKDIDGAKTVLDTAITANPTNGFLKQRRAQFEGDPLAIVLKAIDESKINDTQKDLARWSVYLRAGKPEEAKAALASAVKRDPDVPQVIDAQFEDALIRKDQATMDAIVARAQTLNLDRVGGQLYKARAQLAAGKTRESIGALREVTSKDKNSLLAWRMLGIALMETGKPVEAVDALAQAVAIKPDDMLSINAYIRAKVSVDQSGDALLFARKKHEALGGGGDAEFTEMRLALEANAPGGNRSLAISERQAIQKTQPDNVSNLSKLASLLINADRQEEALPLIDQISAKDPDSIVGVELRAAYLGRKKKYEDAVKFLKDFIERLPKEKRTDELYINVGRLLTQLGQPVEAQTMLESGRQYQEPKKMLVDRELGDTLFQRGEWAASAEAYKRVVDGGSEDPDYNVRKRILECYLKLKRFGDMNAMVAQLPPAGQADPTIILLLAEGASAQNDRVKALKFYDQAVSADPKSAIGYIKRGQFKLAGANATNDAALIKDAEADFDQAIRVDPNSVFARMFKAGVLKQTGRDALAIAVIKEAVQIDPFNETLRLRYVQACEEIGRLQDAAEACDDAIKQFPTSAAWKMKAGRAWGRVGNWARAVEHFGAIWQDRRVPETTVALVEALINKNDITNAYNVLIASAKEIADFEKILPLRMLRARVYAKQDNTAKAAQEINSSFSLVSQDSYEDASIFMSGIAGVYPKRSDQLGALARIEAPKPFTGYLALKVNELRAREESSAAAGSTALEALAGADPNVRVRAAAWSLLGTFSYAANKWEQARDRFVKGIALDPENIELNNNLAYVLAAKLDKGAEALPYALKSAKAGPLNSGFQDTLGICQMAVKDEAAAQITFNTALQLAANDTERAPVYIHLGWLKIKQGDKVEARRLASQARDMLSNLPAARETYGADLQELDKAIDGK